MLNGRGKGNASEVALNVALNGVGWLILEEKKDKNNIDHQNLIQARYSLLKLKDKT